jgi:hypothetical protein
MLNCELSNRGEPSPLFLNECEWELMYLLGKVMRIPTNSSNNNNKAVIVQ